MVDASTTASVFASALTFIVQEDVLDNLRSDLVYADPSYAQEGDFDAGRDTLMFVSVPDLSVSTTPLTEGTRPDKQALSFGTVTVSTSQYGNLVSITDLAKVKSPVQIAEIARERLGRNAAEVVDTVTRNVAAAGGIVSFQGTNTTRAGIGAGEILVAGDLRKLRGKMLKRKIPLFPDRKYRLIVSTEQAYDIRSEAVTGTGAFIDVNRYSRPEQILAGEIGTLEGFRIMETPTAPTASSTVTVHIALAMGAIKAWGAGELQTLTMHHVAPGGDHTDPLAQEELLGWKVNFGVAVLDNDYYYRLESAATDLS
jgi:N4-gp56 family major capsid protein